MKATVQPLPGTRVHQIWSKAGAALHRHRQHLEARRAAVVAMPQSYESTKLWNELAIEQASMLSIFARWQSSYHAWLRGAKWATEDRLAADADAVVVFADQTCRPIAAVIPIRRGRAE